MLVLGTGIGHYIPFVAYLGFWVMCLVSLGGKPVLGFYYMIPFLPYRTMRDHFLNYPLGENMLAILIVTVIVGAIIHGKRLPKSKLYGVWLVYGIYLYFSMWLGTALGKAPAPLWAPDLNFVTWKSYMLIPLIFVAAGLVIEDRRAIRVVVIITAITVLFIDRSFLLETMSRSWGSFDESKRDTGPLAFGSNQTGAFLAQFAMFFWGVVQFAKNKMVILAGYALAALTLFATMYSFSRGAYLAVLVSILVLGLLKDRKLLLVLGVFLLIWQSVVPAPVRERVTMTETSNGQLEASAEERVELWDNAEKTFISSPIFGTGYATYQFSEHIGDLKDTHNWYVKILVETGIIGMLIVLFLLQQLLAVSYRLFKRASDPLYRGLGLGLLLATCACLVANCFGDRWTYIEITGPLWVLAGAVLRAIQLMESEAKDAPEVNESESPIAPYVAYR